MKKLTFLLILPLFLGMVVTGCCHKKVAPAPAPVVEAPPPPPPPEPAPAPPAPAPEPVQEKG